MEVETPPTLVSQGAEGKVYFSQLFGKLTVIKERVSKRYRIKELDLKLNRQRLLQEIRCMTKCRRAGVVTPCLFLVDFEKFQLHLERIDGSTVKDILKIEFSKGKYEGDCVSIARMIGVAIGKMHDSDICHGDLTTSNIMVRQNQRNELEVVIIDFGLATMQTIVEDKAVDLYVLERSFLSTHPQSEHLIAEILDAYRFSCRKGALNLTKLDQVRLRGRKREMVG